MIHKEYNSIDITLLSVLSAVISDMAGSASAEQCPLRTQILLYFELEVHQIELCESETEENRETEFSVSPHRLLSFHILLIRDVQYYPYYALGDMWEEAVIMRRHEARCGAATFSEFCETVLSVQ